MLPQRGSLFISALMDIVLILPDPINSRIMRSLFYRKVRIGVSLFDIGVVAHHPVVDDRRPMVVIDNRAAIDPFQAVFPVIVHTVKIFPVNHDGVVCVSMVPHIDIDPGNIDVIYNHGMRPSPVASAIIPLARRQRNPTQINSGMNP